jgi:hypothetical protein
VSNVYDPDQFSEPGTEPIEGVSGADTDVVDENGNINDDDPDL